MPRNWDWDWGGLRLWGPRTVRAFLSLPGGACSRSLLQHATSSILGYRTARATQRALAMCTLSFYWPLVARGTRILQLPPRRTPLRSSVSHWPTASQPHATTNTASQGSLWIRDPLTSETGETWFMTLVCLSSPLLAIRPPAELAETPRFICTPSNHHGRTRTPPLKQRHSTGDRETPSGLTTGRREDAGTRELGPPGTGPPEHHAVADSFTGTYRHCQAQARASNPYYHLQIKRPPHATTLLSLLEEQRLPKQHWPRGKAIQDPMQIQPSCCLVRLRLVRLALLFPLLLCMTFGHISCP